MVVGGVGLGHRLDTASRVGLSRLARTQPTFAHDLAQHLSEHMPAASEDLRNAAALFARSLSYTERAFPHDDQ
jgi:hypothetical protein